MFLQFAQTDTEAAETWIPAASSSSAARYSIFPAGLPLPEYEGFTIKCLNDDVGGHIHKACDFRICQSLQVRAEL
jgi:hypothetical protein